MFKLFFFTQSFEGKEKQQDPGEFLKKWLEPLVSAVPNVTKPLEVVAQIERKCQGPCGVSTQMPTVDHEIILGAKNTLVESLAAHFGKAVIDCKLSDCKCLQAHGTTEETVIMNLPPNMIFVLRRYEDNVSKQNKVCTIPSMLDISPYCSKFYIFNCFLFKLK